MTGEEINRLGELLRKRDSLFGDSMTLNNYIESAKGRDEYIFSHICNALNEKRERDYYDRDDNIFNRVIRENKDLLFKFVCNIFEAEQEKISRLIEENNAQIEAVKIDFGEENA